MSQNVINHLLYGVWNILDMLFLLWYMATLCGKPKNPAALLSIAALLVLFTTFAMQPGTDYVNLLAITFMSLFLLPLYPGGLQRKVLFGAELLAIASFWGIASYFLYTIVLGAGQGLEIVNILLSHGVFWLLLWLAPKMGRGTGGSLSYKAWGVLLSIPLASLGLLACVLPLASSSQLPTQQLSGLGLVVFLIVLFINLMVFYLFERFSTLARAETERALLAQQVALQESNFRRQQEAHLQIRGLRHDMKNSLQTAQSLAEKGLDSELKAFLASLTRQVARSEAFVSTGNQSFDTVLNVKLSELKESGIDVKTSIAVPGTLSMTFEQAVVLLGNILDNAREACMKLPPKQRWVQFSAKGASHGMLFVSVKNPVAEEALKDAQTLASGKGDVFLHGLGLKNVRRVAQAFNGTVEAEVAEGEFHLRLILYKT